MSVALDQSRRLADGSICPRASREGGVLQNIKGILIGLTEEGDAEETSTAFGYGFPWRGRRAPTSRSKPRPRPDARFVSDFAAG